MVGKKKQRTNSFFFIIITGTLKLSQQPKQWMMFLPHLTTTNKVYFFYSFEECLIYCSFFFH